MRSGKEMGTVQILTKSELHSTFPGNLQESSHLGRSLDQGFSSIQAAQLLTHDRCASFSSIQSSCLWRGQKTKMASRGSLASTLVETPLHAVPLRSAIHHSPSHPSGLRDGRR